MNPSWCSLLGDPQGWVEIAMRQLLSLLNAYAALLLVILSVGVVLRAVRIVQEKITGLRRKSAGQSRSPCTRKGFFGSFCDSEIAEISSCISPLAQLCFQRRIRPLSH